jgi:hypothetical protein
MDGSWYSTRQVGKNATVSRPGSAGWLGDRRRNHLENRTFVKVGRRRSRAMPVVFSMIVRASRDWSAALTSGDTAVATLPCRSMRASSRADRDLSPLRDLMTADRSMSRGKSTCHPWPWPGV